jgi:hypothetical protein
MKICFLLFLFFTCHLLAASEYNNWSHKGNISIITTPEGADLPSSAKETNVPLLVRLNKDTFNFSETQKDGSDIRFSIQGKPLKYSIESWDAKNGTALIWVLVPEIKGNEIQTLNVHWGKSSVKSETDPKALFGTAGNYVTVNHMDSDQDVLKSIKFTINGTKIVKGLIGKCRQYEVGDLIKAPKNIETFPKKTESHSTSIWFKAFAKGGDLIGWGSGGRQGKVVLQLKTPGPHINVDAWFSRANIKTKQTLQLNEWTHIVHTYSAKETSIYVNGELHTKFNGRGTPMNLLEKSLMAIGGWGRGSAFEGQIDEVRISNVPRSSVWIRLQYENQRPMQRLVGHLKQSGNKFNASIKELTLNEGDETLVKAAAGGADKIYWSIISKGNSEAVAVDCLSYRLQAGRVSKDTKRQLEIKAVYGKEVKKIVIPIIIKERIPDPAFTLKAPENWDGRTKITVTPEISNLSVLQKLNMAKLDYQWVASDIAVSKYLKENQLLLTRAHNSGNLKVKLTLSNGGEPVTKEITIKVTEPKSDPWVYRAPSANEMPQDLQFYARTPQNVGFMYCNGTVEKGIKEVFLKVYADDKPYKSLKQAVKADGTYSLKVELKPGLIKYRIEFGHSAGSKETVTYQAKDIVCGDAYLIQGQSNALATDIREKSPQVTNEWVISYARRSFYKEGEKQNLWCLPVWKMGREYKAELGWWGVDLANRLVAKHKVPVFILNGAKGGTRIDQHQRIDEDPEDESTIYGRMLWRIKQAKMTHAIKAVIWHQGESDQGSAGPGGELGWKRYQQYFVDMAADWKEDFPNIHKHYIFQIRPNACSMGGGNGDMLRERIRTIPYLYSNMDILSTHGIVPPGGCHYPFAGWSVFADMLHPLIARDFYGEKTNKVLTAPNLKRAYYSNSSNSEITLEFDQEIVWKDLLVFDFYLDGHAAQVKQGKESGNKLILTLNNSSQAKKISYLKEMSWKPERLLIGKNGLAALTFSNVTIERK